MYAIIKTGGKQYRVRVGDVIAVELLDSNTGDQIEFNEVLFVHDGSHPHIGGPFIANFSVFGKVLGEVKGEKVTSLKYKRSHNTCRKWGHRQRYTEFEITGIEKRKHKKEE